MKVVQVIPGIRELASGPSYSVPALCRSLAGDGVDLELHVGEGKEPPGANYRFFEHGKWNWPPRLDVSPAMRRATERAAKNADLLHNHSLWAMANIYVGWAAQRTGCPLVVSPRGTLNPYARNRSRWKKTLIWHLWQRKVLHRADCFHATSRAEADAIRSQGLTAPVAVIPNGVDLPDLSNGSVSGQPARRRLLFLSRITPIKALDHLLKAWADLEHRFPDWELQVTGIDDRGHAEKMKALAASLKLRRLRFTGPVYGADKTRAFLAADLFVLPSHSENFGMAVAEALAHSLPAVVTKGAPWQGLQTQDCGWWIDIGVEPLVECLRTALAETPQALKARGQRGRAWVRREFSWAGVARQMRDTYQWILDGGQPPQCVCLE